MDSSRFFGTLSTSTSDEPLEVIITELKDQRTLIQELFERNEETKLATASCFQGIKDSFDLLLERVKNIETKSDGSGTTSGSAPTKTSTKCPKELSSALKKLYSNVEDNQLRFNVEKNYGDSFNQKIAEFYSDQLQKEYGSSYSKLQISKAVHRYYQSRRRSHKDSMPNRTDQKLKNDKRTRRTQRQRNLFQRRGKYVKNGKEREYWQMITHEYMSEESSGEEDGCPVFRVHSPNWRSDAFSNLIKRLDRRMEGSTDNSTPKRTGFLRCKRIESDKLQTTRPTSAPLWTYKSNKSNTNDNASETTSPDDTQGPNNVPSEPATMISQQSTNRGSMQFDAEFMTLPTTPHMPSSLNYSRFIVEPSQHSSPLRERPFSNIDNIILGQNTSGRHSRHRIHPSIQTKSIASATGQKQSTTTPKSHQMRYKRSHGSDTLRQGHHHAIRPRPNIVLDDDLVGGEPAEDLGDEGEDSSDWNDE